MSYLLREFEIERVSMKSVAFSTDGNYIVSGASDAYVHVWDVNRGEQVCQMKHRNSVNTVTFSYDGTRILSCSLDKTIRIWNTKGDELLRIENKYNSFMSAAFTRDGSKVVCCNSNKGNLVYDASTGEELVFIYWDTDTFCVALNHNDSQVASACEDTLVRTWDPNTGDIIATFKGHEERVTCVTFNSDGSKIASGSQDETIRVFDVNTQDQLARLQHPETVLSVAWNGSYVVSGSKDEYVRVWDALNEQNVLELEHGGAVLSVGFNQDGSKLVSGSDDWTVRVWKLPSLSTKGENKVQEKDTCGLDQFETYTRKQMVDGEVYPQKSMYIFDDKGKSYTIKYSDSSAEIVDIKEDNVSIFEEGKPNITGKWDDRMVEIENVFFQDAKGKGYCTMAVSYLLKVMLNEAAKQGKFPYLGKVYIFSRMPCPAVNCYTHAFMNNTFVPNPEELKDFKMELSYWLKQHKFRYTFEKFYSDVQLKKYKAMENVLPLKF